MKILVAHDGSEASRDAVEDLPRAGLPPFGEAVVLSVADVWLGEAQETGPLVHEVHSAAEKALAAAKDLADQGAELVRNALPGWKVTSDAVANSPAFAILQKAEEISPSLIVTGCRG